MAIRGAPVPVERADELTADLPVDVTALGPGADEVEIVHVGNTTLLQQFDPTSVSRLPAGREIALRAPASGTASITLTLVPGRCDPHAIAEDKQGTRFPVRVNIDGTTGTVPLVAPDEVKVALYDFVREACSP